MTDWHFGYEFNTPIVGESNYQPALDKTTKTLILLRKAHPLLLMSN